MCKAHSKVTHIKQQKYFHHLRAVDIIRNMYFFTFIMLNVYVSFFTLIAKYRKSGILGYRSSLTPEPVELK